MIEKQLEVLRGDIAHLRRVYTLLDSTETRRIIDKIQDNPEKVAIFKQLCQERNVSKLKYWIKRQIDPELGELGVRALRQVASMHNIPFYYRMTKTELIQEINKCQSKE